MKKRNNVFIVRVKCEMGSDFQYESAKQAMQIYLDTLKFFYESKHKDTNIRVIIDEYK